MEFILASNHDPDNFANAVALVVMCTVFGIGLVYIWIVDRAK